VSPEPCRRFPANVKTVRLAGFATKKQDRNELQNLKSAGGYGAIACATSGISFGLSDGGPTEGTGLATLGTLGPRCLDTGLRETPDHGLSERRRFESLHADSSVARRAAGNSGGRVPSRSARLPHGIQDLRFSSYLAKGEMERDYLGRVCGVDAGRIRIGAPSSSSQENASVWNERAPWIAFFTNPMRPIPGE